MQPVVHQKPRRRRASGGRRGVRQHLETPPCSLDVAPELVERPGSHERIRTMVREIRILAFGRAHPATGPAEAPTNLETKGRHGRSGSRRFRSAVCRTGWKDPRASGALREGEWIALLVLSGPARPGERNDVGRNTGARPADVGQQILLDALPRLRSGTGGVEPVAIGAVRLHHAARAVDRPFDPPVAKREGARPGAGASRRPSLPQRTRNAIGVGLKRTSRPDSRTRVSRRACSWPRRAGRRARGRTAA